MRERDGEGEREILTMMRDGTEERNIVSKQTAR